MRGLEIIIIFDRETTASGYHTAHDYKYIIQCGVHLRRGHVASHMCVTNSYDKFGYRVTAIVY